MKMAPPMKSILLLIIVFCLSIISAQNRTFTIDYDNNTFLKDGKPFHYISGSLHYSRVHPYYWKDRLTKMYAAGLNAVQTYVPWNFHQPEINAFNFTGGADLEGFLKTAQEVGLLVILRAGPYICGEWEFGGFPAWILKENPYTVFRTMDKTYIKYVDIWMDALYTKIKPLVYSKGGPVIMIQIENEYGSYYACDHVYTQHLMTKASQHFGNSVIIFTTDGNHDSDLKCGKTDGAYATVDFGVTYNPEKSFQPQRDYEPNGPLVNSEFYTGWLDHWGYPHSTRDLDSFCTCLDAILKLGANVNMYMFEGGTNFGYWNGANYPPYQAVPTSYDYDAPLTEAGDITDKYIAIRQVISKYRSITVPIPKSTPKAAYGKVSMTFSSTIQDVLDKISPGPKTSQYPPTMEQISQYQGFALYRHELKNTLTTPTNLSAPGLKDRGYVMIDKVPIGIIKRGETTTVTLTGKAGQTLDILVEIQGHITAGSGTNNDSKVPQGVMKRGEETSLQITGKAGQTLDILVENTGHIGFGSGMNNESKGIGNVTLGSDVLQDWKVYPIALEKFNPADGVIGSGPIYNGNMMTPSLFVGKLTIPDHEPNDTYFDMSSWSKGQLFINNNNVGRYWPVIGPQVRLYVPKPFLQTQSPNYVVMFELEKAPCQKSETCFAEFVDKPIINAPTHGPDVKISDKSQYDKYYGLNFWKFGTGHDSRRVDFPNYFPPEIKTRN